MTDAAVWQAVLGELEISTSKANFQTWLRNTKLLSLNDAVATISVPNIFIRSWLENHYKDQFLASFKKQVPSIETIRFEIEGSEVAPAPEVVPVYETTNKKPSSKPASRELAEELPTTISRGQVFETFVEGNNNRLAYAVSRAVANSPGTLYNPLFIYGGVGLGKTHLMHAIANHVLAQDSAKRVLYVSSEKFTNDYIGSISSKNMTKFKQTYRTLDLLLVDDIQFIATKEGTQEEFFNTFNTLHQSNRQIVIAADRVPKAIPGLEERLSSRFGWGMVVDIQPPNYETRLAILRSKCQEKGLSVPEEALDYIANQVHSNIRELEGALNRFIIYCQMSHVPLSYESARAALSGLITPVQQRTYSMDTVLSLLAEHFGINLADLIGKKRTKELVYPRHVAMYILKEELNMSFPQIGREMGGKDHTTVMHGCNKIIAELPNNTKIQSDVARIKDRLANL